MQNSPKSLRRVPAGTHAALAGMLIALAGTLACAGCASSAPEYTYWLRDSATGIYTPHRTFTALSDEELAELGLVSELPADAKISE